jgi:valyl-tRNA synthetase
MNPSLPDSTPANNQQIIDQIDNFIAGLSPENKEIVSKDTSKVTTSIAVNTPKTTEEMQTFVIQHSAELVENSVKSIMELQKLTVATGDPEMMAGLASLIAASTGAIETVNKIHLQAKKAEANKEMKLLELEGKKEIQRLKNDGYLNLPAGNTNILVATREEIIAQLTGKAKEKSVNTIDTIEAISSPLSTIQLPLSS